MAGRGEVGELAEAAGDEMFDGEARAFGFVGEHGADAVEPVVNIVDVDDRQPLLAELLHLEAAGDAGDDAVAAPAVGDRGALFVIARVDQEMPVGVLLGEVGDAADDLAAPTGFGFDEDGDLADAKLIVIVGLIVHGRIVTARGDEEFGVEWTIACIASV